MSDLNTPTYVGKAFRAMYRYGSPPHVWGNLSDCIIEAPEFPYSKKFVALAGGLGVMIFSLKSRKEVPLHKRKSIRSIEHGEETGWAPEETRTKAYCRIPSSAQRSI
jgi:hypothetical protein